VAACSEGWTLARVDRWCLERESAAETERECGIMAEKIEAARLTPDPEASPSKGIDTAAN
jgi:hypothetical protein